MRRRREIETFSLSFLDVVSCGFGAIILLLIISKVVEPRVIEEVGLETTDRVLELQRGLAAVRAKGVSLNRAVDARQQALTEKKDELVAFERHLTLIRRRAGETAQRLATQSAIETQLASAKQALSEEMRRLNQRRRALPPDDVPIGGIPVDSEYIIFIIDTSGSMFQNAWPALTKKISETLAVYPDVKGIQVMNDMGEYMFSQYAGRWIPDTPARRKAILQRLAGWRPFSNSSPVEGIARAIRRFYGSGKKISLYVLGDEFSSGSIDSVIREVDALNRTAASGERRVRIHAIGFPVQFQYPGPGQLTGIRFAALMRLLTQKNGGAFVGLSDFRP